MEYNDHSDLSGQHAFLSPSKYHWVTYSKEKLVDTYKSFKAVERGVRLHELAHQLIELRQRLPKKEAALNMFVNDAIGFGMVSELVLYYSPNAFGTADALVFRDKILRIHDLKTGESAASLKQLYVYAALFCLEYGMNPDGMGFELRLYQGSTVDVANPHPEEITLIMERIVEFDKLINKIESETGEPDL